LQERKRKLVMEELLKSLPKVLRAHQDSPELKEAAAFAAWNHAIGDGLKQHTTAKRLEGKTLIVAVLDSMKSHLLFRVNSILGQPLLNNIELVIDPKSLKVTSLEKKADVTVDNEVPIELWSAASAIEDRQLRQKFLRAAIAALKRKER
jgi:Dna[CI] antecedent, DciA